MSFARGPLLWVVMALALVACGDLTDSVGKQGRLRFTLGTDFEVAEDELTDATLVAGHVQRIDVQLTSKGDEDIEEPDEITYRIDPGTGTDLDPFAGSENDPPDLDVLVQKPGRYSIDAIYKGNIVDSIDLAFDTPDNLELSVKVRAPFDDDFDDVPSTGGSIAVVEGTQATFLPIPKKGTKRLAGAITTKVAVTPKELVVPGQGASLVYEQSVWSAEGNVDFYFIDPGSVTITISDPKSGASGAFTFEVTDFAAP